MRIPRLYVNAALVLHQPTALTGEQAHRLTRVLRLRADATLRVFNGEGGEYTCTLQRNGQHWRVLPTGKSERDVRSALRIMLAQSITRSERMDFALQKAVELGVTRIQPILAERSTFKPQSRRLHNRQAHWQRIVIQTCEQCGRTDLPELLDPCPSQDWMADNPSAIMLCADAQTSLSELPLSGSDVAVLVGPEGGFSADEIRAARGLGLATASLGPRTLRTETTALVALTVLQIRCGDLG
ncbi:MAG: 16S rRNA (uracil(1498)-N(3))-methyltransferase [Gammaproteobacteria bacterium]|nr:16S rRNA (uracil(1498)-N(3))-methyltransferase [Gammaproteobacteria bacterium]